MSGRSTSKKRLRLSLLRCKSKNPHPIIETNADIPDPVQVFKTEIEIIVGDSLTNFNIVKELIVEYAHLSPVSNMKDLLNYIDINYAECLTLYAVQKIIDIIRSEIN